MALSTTSAAGPASGFYPGDVPRTPGVYVFRDLAGKVIYVGKAVDLRRRLAQYFQKSRQRLADPRLRSLVGSIAAWECHPVRSETEALLLESRLIKEYAPHYNVLLRDDKRFLLLKLDPREPLPRLRAVRLRKDDGARYFGPFPQGRAVRATAEFLTRRFGLRSCRVAEPDAVTHRHCLASIVKDCSAPCVGKVTPEAYRQRVAELLAVLAGDGLAPILAELRGRMARDAATRHFEKAAAWRDLIENLETVCGTRHRTFRFASLPGAEAGAVADLQDALRTARPPDPIEAFDISNLGGTLAVASMVCFRDGRPDRAGYRRFRIRTVDGSNDVAMMAEALGRHYGRRLRENKPLPGLILIDGGKGQLNAALKALVQAGCPPLPILGLAKRQEEIFLPGRDQPLVLDRHRPALRLLQAVRDEAHRFAIAYHRGLRDRRLQESLLDEIPGIGPARKRSILAAFGSIRRLRQATAEDLAERVPGLGATFAQRISDSLAATPGTAPDPSIAPVIGVAAK
jgi:excinuclease ABC subunit C